MTAKPKQRHSKVQAPNGGAGSEKRVGDATPRFGGRQKAGQPGGSRSATLRVKEVRALFHEPSDLARQSKQTPQTQQEGRGPLPAALAPFTVRYRSELIGRSLIVLADCFDWLGQIPEGSVHAVVTDPPYGVKEYDFEQIEKRANGKGGVWRLPPSFDGHRRAPLPRFSALTADERQSARRFFTEWARLTLRSLRPGGHVIIASSALLSQLLFSSLVEGGLEFRGQLIRLVRTLRGGDRPKNAEEEFPGVSSLPRGCYEPWGIFRKPVPNGMKLSDCLRQFQTGGLRRTSDANPFCDVILSQRTPRREREIANHPSLKPQSFLRQVVRAALPLGEGIVVDPFMGSGSTVAAAEAFGVSCIGVERHRDYYEMSRTAIPALAAIHVQPAEQLALPVS